jgi:hypothetical protein
MPANIHVVDEASRNVVEIQPKINQKSRSSRSVFVKITYK